MYKFLLCWRYLKARWIALASIVSVTLGVATMIVVNAVMSGFQHEMHVRLKGILADVIIESRSFEGLPDPEAHLALIRRHVGQEVESATVSVHVPAMLSFQVGGRWITRPVTLIGIDPATCASTCRFAEYLQHPANRSRVSFQLHEGGYYTRDPEGGEKAGVRRGMDLAGWPWRRWRARQRLSAAQGTSPLEGQAKKPQGNEQSSSRDLVHLELSAAQLRQSGTSAQAAAALYESLLKQMGYRLVEKQISPQGDLELLAAPGVGGADEQSLPQDPFAAAGQQEQKTFDPAREQYTGCILGMAIASVRRSDGSEDFLLLPGDDVKLTLPTAGTPPKAVTETFTVVDFYASKMSEYDANFVFVPIDKLQELRGMLDPETGTRYVSSIQLKLRDPSKAAQVRDRLRKVFSSTYYVVQTWRDRQGPLLAAVQMETAILNVLLFLIIAVAGFGILAIFFMIVVEKTRDIGILKALGAHSTGVLGVFLGYGLSLGMVGAGAGLALGLLFVHYLNQIADGLGRLTGHRVFDPSIYYFYEIPTLVDVWTVAWIVLGALAIAVLASVWPATRAARLRVVEALRYE